MQTETDFEVDEDTLIVEITVGPNEITMCVPCKYDLVRNRKGQHFIRSNS